jgi:protein-tyrosine-phosphatase
MALKKVLFICWGNAIRSQMAEAFARTYGADVLIPQSAGLMPTMTLAPLTRETMLARHISLDDHFAKGLENLGPERFDVVVNLSGYPLTIRNVPASRDGVLLEWKVKDPMGSGPPQYEKAACEIEALVMKLIQDLREKKT